jgi:tetratricopeptide (TPR) repeat protein
VFWVDVGSPDIARSDFVIIGDMLGHKIDTVKEACRLLDNIRESCLLILDNADDPTFDYSVYLPSGLCGAVLVASRCTDLSRLSTAAYEALQDLGLADCIELLLKAANIPREQWTTQVKDAEDVVRLLHSHTLALVQAGAYVAKGHCKLKEYPKVFERNRQRLLEFSISQARSRYQHVYATFEASAAVLSAHALDLLGILSMLDRTAVPESMFESVWRGSQNASAGVAIVEPGLGLGDISAWDVSQFYCVTDMTGNKTGLDVLNEWHVSQLPAFIGAKENTWDAYDLTEAISLLSSLLLITKTMQDGVNRLSMHPLVHAWARDRQSQETREVNWIRAGCVIALATRGSTERAQVECSVQAHVQWWVDGKESISVLCCTRKEVLALVWSCSWMLVQMRDDARLECLLEAVFQEAELEPSQPTSFLVSLYHLRAQSYCLNGRYQVAVELMERVVRIRQETLDWKHENRVSAEHLLAVVYRANGQTKEAIALLEHVVKVHKTTLAETHPDRLTSQHELAVTYRANMQTKEAVALLEHVVKVKQTTLAETHPDRLVSQHELAVAYQANRQTKEAIALLEHVVKVQETTLAETHPDRLASQHELARAYNANGQMKEAIALLEHVVKVQETTLAETHPDQLGSQHALACAYHANGQIKEALTLLEHVVKMDKTIMPPTHPSRKISESVLAFMQSRAESQST